MTTSTIEFLEQLVATVPTFPLAIAALEDALREARVRKAQASSECAALTWRQRERALAAILALIQKPDQVPAGDEGLTSIV